MLKKKRYTFEEMAEKRKLEKEKLAKFFAAVHEHRQNNKSYYEIANLLPKDVWDSRSPTGYNLIAKIRHIRESGKMPEYFKQAEKQKRQERFKRINWLKLSTAKENKNIILSGLRTGLFSSEEAVEKLSQLIEEL